ncbi:hypothetical protein HN446_01635 [bacterium]|jgi:hypothetical protein|nr:hypothetical protein [bacterium]
MIKKISNSPDLFSGNIFIFHAFDIGDSISLEGIKKAQLLLSPPQTIPKYFKNYHTPLSVELPHPHSTSKCISVNLHHFGAVGLVYQVPFQDTLENLRKELSDVDNEYQEQSISDLKALYKKIKPHIFQPNFFHHKTSYIVVQVDPSPKMKDIDQITQNYGNIIASMLRLEDVQLSDEQKDEILDNNIGYYRKDLVLIDTECAFVYDAEYHELLNFFEFANLQQLELQYFDNLLEKQLNTFYEKRGPSIPLKSYLPFVGLKNDPISELDKLRVDISVITERLENSIKITGEAYYTELYAHLIDKLNLLGWQESIERKLSVLRDIKTVYNDKINTFREHMLETLIIILIFIELMVGIFK